MKANRLPATLSPLDTDRWKVLTARAPTITSEILPDVLAFCRQHAVRFLIARCPTADLGAARSMEREGFHIMDTLVYFSRDLARPMPEEPALLSVREVLPGEEGAVAHVAAKAFEAYGGHYHADPRLDRRECDAAYVDWARRSCLSRELADAVLVGTLEAEIVGFIAVRLNSEEEGEVALYAVMPGFQRRSMGRSLLVNALGWCRARRRARMIISTQITNLASLKLWTRLGFEPSNSYYTFHKWF